MSKQNTCQRCARKLSNPQATYGWRCAEKLGVAEVLSKAPYQIFLKFTEGIQKAERMFKNLFEHSTRKMNDILSSVAKWNLWEGIDEKKAQNAKKQVFKKVDGSDNFNIKIDLKKEIVSAWQSLKDKANDIANDTVNTISNQSKKLAKEGKLDDVTNHVLEYHDKRFRFIDHSLNGDFSEENYKHNSKIDLSSYKGKYINDQYSGVVSKLKFGNHNMDYNGCEIIGVYNSLLTLGNPKDIRDIAYEFEKDGQMLGGSFGTNPYAAERYLKKEGYKVTTIKGEDIVNKDIPDADAYLLSFWNTDDVMDGLHTVSVKKEKDNTYTFYNDDAIEEEEVPASSIPKRIEVKHYQPIILQCIYKKDE